MNEFLFYQIITQMPISQTTIDFLNQISKNNNKNWFDENKTIYLNAQSEIISVLKEWHHGIKSHFFNWEIEEYKKCIFRIYRDVRFSQDKTPYKTHIGAVLSPQGKKGGDGFYLHIEPNKSFVACGFWQPESDTLNAIRQEIDYNTEEWMNIVNDLKFLKLFGAVSNESKLKKVPKGYPVGHEAAEFLKLKSFTISCPLNDTLILDEHIATHLINISEAMLPFYNFLKRAID